MNHFAQQLNILIALVTVAAMPSANAAEVRTVALHGAPAPGTTSGVFYDGFSFIAPALNDVGQTAFYATLVGDDVDNTNNQGIWSEGSGSLSMVARTGSAAPGLSGVTFGGLGAPLLSNVGRTAFFGFADRGGIWSEGAGSLALVARGGDPAAGIPAGPIHPINYGEFGPLLLNDAGRIAFSARLTSISGPLSIPGNDKANWSDRSGNVAVVVRAGDQVPDAPAGVKFGYALTSFGSTDELVPVLNNAGRIAFLTRLVGGGVTSSNNRGIWSDGSGSLAMVARSGNQAPGTPSGVIYASFGGFAFTPPALNDAGKTAFYANLTGSGVDSTNNGGIWSEGSGNLALVARNGSPAPGTTSGVNFSSLAWLVVMNNSGKTAFESDLAGSGVDATNSAGIWSEGRGSLALVARTGDAVPGALSGVRFGDFGDIVLNDAGQTAFSAHIIGSEVEQFVNDAGIWATDPTGVLQLVARTGDSVEVAPGDFRTISQLVFSAGTGNSDGRPSGFNNVGQVAFAAAFTDGTSGIFVSNRVAVPEPSSLLLLCFGSLAVLWRRRGLVCASVLAAVVCAATSAHAVTIDTVPVGNVGNANDPATGNLNGGVNYAYNIGKYEVTVGQYTAFLNAVAATDTYALYHMSMAEFPYIAGISRSGASGSYSYSVIGSALHPVTFVSWGDAARFANWLHNGQPTGAQNVGTTEDGAYTLNGATTNTALNAVSRNANAYWFIPSESEWYKAAYHQPAAQGGDADNYWNYPMKTNSLPYSDQPPGATPDNTRVGNFRQYDGLENGYDDGFAVPGSPSLSGNENLLTDVGAYTSSPSFYGTFDQGGNVFEWNEAIIISTFLSRSLRGGSYFFDAIYLPASNRGYFFVPTHEFYTVGFRVASNIPEPSTLLLLCFGSLAVLWRRGALMRQRLRDANSTKRVIYPST